MRRAGSRHRRRRTRPAFDTSPAFVAPGDRLVSLQVDLRVASGRRARASGILSTGCLLSRSTTESNPQKADMANIKSQLKRIGTNTKAHERNKAVKSEVKTAIRATREAIAAGDAATASAALVVASKKLDKAASKGVLHKNQAANRKSAIAKQVAAL